MQTLNRYFDRDLSWLSFNYRVLEEAKDPRVPLYERIKFMAIYSSNLDEFFRVRVAAIRSAIKVNSSEFSQDSNLAPEQLLAQVLQIVSSQQSEFGKIYREEILPQLREQNIVLYHEEKILPEHLPAVVNYFRNKVLAYMQPVIFSERSKSVFLVNRALYFVVELSRKGDETMPIRYALVNIPSDHLPRFYKLPSIEKTRYYIFLDDIVRCNLRSLFPGYEVKGAYSIKLNRDSDLGIEDEYTGDLITKIKKQLDVRNLGVPARFLYDKNIPEVALRFMMETLDINESDIVRGGRYHNFYDLFSLPNPIKPQLEDIFLPSLNHPDLDRQESLFEALLKREYILHFPYSPYDYVLRFFNEAAVDPFVTEIKLTVYRMATDSFIANALISAVRNGKKVTVFVEVKARFDEANNLKWAETMEKEGIKIIYSIPGLKVHAKVALIIRKKDKKRQEFAYFGTGNFNEKTALIYADHGFFTAHQEMTNELNQVFKYLNKRKEEPHLKHLLVSQFNIVPRFMELIDREISHALHGRPARMIIKINNLEDPVMIDKLYEANRAGVKIDLIIRSICCLVPGISGMSENITVTRILDRYLEHARVYIFENNGNPALFLGSADWMKRNLYHRVEVVFPIYDPQIKEELLQITEIQLKDNVKAVHLDEFHHNIRKTHAEDTQPCRAQEEIYHFVKSRLSIENT
ncbi:MAG: polyphosphate kinase 1 [Microscillaceae bacterium]|nr:polyphosphate kinase 1 [Microscillaceae bacterium]